MSLFVSRSFFQFGFSCVSALVLFGTQAGAQTMTVTESLQNIDSTTPTLTLPNFNAAGETLIDVTFTLMLGNNPVTVFDAQNPSQNLINVSFLTSGHSSSANNFSNWEISPGNLEITYTEDTGNASKYGGAAQFLFGTHDGLGNEWLKVNFECTGGGNNNTGGSPGGGNGSPSDGGSPATPEPGVPFLSLIAAGAMALLLIGRKARQRTDAKQS